ncbi:NAD(P)-dependent dehydrogenase (short-subunit alcohol dehydrogenase family) [Bradyrhizobium sp. USDA 3315]
MKIRNKHIVVTGGASGIGQALCQAFAREGARSVVVADIDEAGAQTVAAGIGGYAQICNVAIEADVQRLIEQSEARSGPIDLFCSNAGIAAGFQSDFKNAAAAANDVWQRAWAVNVMAHVYAARSLIPRMLERGGGYFACFRRSAAPFMLPQSTRRSASPRIWHLAIGTMVSACPFSALRA